MRFPGLRVGPEDRGPLTAEEIDDLVEFMRKHMPHMFDAMRRLRERDPDRFEERLNENAVRLRQLRRLFLYSPEIGDVIRSHAHAQFEMRRAAKALAHGGPESYLYDRAMKELRERVAETVRLETRVLELLLAEREANRDGYVEARVDYLLSENADLAAEPERVRDMVALYSTISVDAEREAQRERITTAVARQIENEIRALGERIASMRENAAEEVDRRVERVLEAVERRGRPPQGRGPGEGRRR